MLDVDELGLDEIDRRILRTIVEKFDGGPVGVDTISAATSEEADTIMDVYEPYLIQLGFSAANTARAGSPPAERTSTSRSSRRRPSTCNSSNSCSRISNSGACGRPISITIFLPSLSRRLRSNGAMLRGLLVLDRYYRRHRALPCRATSGFSGRRRSSGREQQPRASRAPRNAQSRHRRQGGAAACSIRSRTAPGKRSPSQRAVFPRELRLHRRRIDAGDRGHRAARRWAGQLRIDPELLAELDRFGTVPLPPYIHERLDDPNRYQTVYSSSSRIGSRADRRLALHP